ADDDVFRSAGNAQIALRVERAEIAGHEPAALVEGVLGRRLVVEIAEHEARAAAAELADLARRGFEFVIVRLEDAELVARAARAGGLDDQPWLIVGHRVLMAAILGHAVAAL